MTPDAHQPDTRSADIPRWLTVAYTVFMAVLVPVYWYCYGPTNFLYFCDVALFATLFGMWLRSPLLISMAAVGIVAPQILWVVDFLVGLAGGRLIGMSEYMFNADRSLSLRALSLFHGWLPFLLVWLVWRVGYDRRALWCWTVVAWILLVVCYTLMPGPRPDAADIAAPVNINYVFGLGDTAPQTWMPPLAWLAMLMVGLPLVVYWPSHLVLARFFSRGR